MVRVSSKEYNAEAKQSMWLKKAALFRLLILGTAGYITEAR